MNSFHPQLTWRTVLATAFAAALMVASPGLALAAADETVALRFAVLGDAEPKPLAEFPHMAAAVRDVNALASRQRVDFVIGVGDIAHDGTLVQYEAATPVLQALTLPFYPIMGNEEHTSTEDRFLEFANRWNQGKARFTSRRYVQDRGMVRLIHASPDHGRDFDDTGIDWILQQLREAGSTPAFLIVHGAQTGVYPENAEKGIRHRRFAEVVAQPNLAAVISGDLHMDMDRVAHSKHIGGVHYLHMPALERTKIPDETRHTPMFRVLSIHTDGTVDVATYQVGTPDPLERHAYRFALPEPGTARSEASAHGDP